MTASMSRKGNCWDSTAMESFFNSSENEHVHYARYPSRETARQDLFDYIEGFYNRRRRHYPLGYVSPEEYYAGWLTQQKLAE